ncbi:MAG: SDR family oxidoreductase [Sphingomonadales bacterium]|nr:SDR family oxidoreductase [Sphingomonadales bacterium]MDE2569493.1 SDR family oxidoreductase [Sphingomonadales bacterium]
MTQVAIVTGAAGGIGSAVARLLGRTRFLLLTDVNAARLEALLATLSDEGYMAEGMPGDLAEPAVAEELAERCQRAGSLRAIVNTAGLSPAQADWQAIVRANSIGPLRLLDALEPLLCPGSACVMVASVAGHLGFADAAADVLLADALLPGLLEGLESRLKRLVAVHGGTMTGHAYSLTKRGILLLCERRALDWGTKGARIVSLSPGVVWTPMGRLEAASGDRAQALVDATPAGRWGTAMEIATTAEFLLSDAAGYITGSDVRVDGGAVAAMRGASF